MRRMFAALLAMAILLPAGAQAASPLDWYLGKTGGTQAPAAPEGPAPIAGEAVAYREQKLVSALFGGATVGSTLVPEGWTVQLRELSLQSESISWPNAVDVTVTSPDGACVMRYQSQRNYAQSAGYAAGFTATSADDGYDRSTMMHTLDYREAAGVCDLMVGILFEGSYSPVAEHALSAEDEAYLRAARERYSQETAAANEMAAQATGGSVSIRWSDVTMAERTYRSGESMAEVAAISAGMDFYSDLGMGAWSEYVYWNVAGLYAMKCPAEDYERCKAIYDVFAANTGVSQEYVAMTERHAEHLQQYFLRLKNGESVSEPEESAALDAITEDTVGQGETYSAEEGWSDVIRDETDYTTTDGSRVKLPSYYDHVFEGDDGTIYAGSSVDGPAGSVELSPTRIGG